MTDKLFQKHLWGLTLPEPFDNVPDRKSTVFLSKYNSNHPSKSTLYAPLLRAIIAYANLQYESENGGTSKCAIGMQGDDVVIAEYESNVRTAVVFLKKQGKFIAASADNSGIGNFSPYLLGPNGKSGSALFYALMPVLLEDKEFEENYDKFYEQLKLGYPYLELVYEVGFKMCDNVYRRIELGNMSTVGIEIDIPATNNIALLTPLAIQSGVYNPDTIIYGNYSIFKAEKIKKEHETVKPEDFIGKYKLSDRNFTDKECSLVPKLPNWYQIPHEVENICKHIKETSASNMPIKNIMLRGPAGTGKTEAAKAIAAGLGLPFMFLTCSANTEVFDLIGQILPDMDASFKDDSLPNFDDIMMDPGSVYCKLTGEYKEDANNQEVYELLVNKARANDNNQKGFKYIETPLIKAIKYGYCVEIQEPAIISNPGVLVGLNGLLDKCESITLPTGEVIKRHPECVIVITTNTDYEGCKSMNQSVISRMNMIYDMDELSKIQLVNRVMSVTGCNNQSLVEQMADVVIDIAQKRKESMITDGSCGVREFIAWVQSTMLTNNPYESAMYTIIPLATADPECREELINSCLSTRIQ